MIGGAANAEQPTAQGAQRGVKGQSAPLQNPEHRHYRKRREKRPDADMQQHQHNGQRTARVQTKEPYRTLGIAPMDVDNIHDAKAFLCALSRFRLKFQKILCCLNSIHRGLRVSRCKACDDPIKTDVGNLFRLYGTSPSTKTQIDQKNVNLLKQGSKNLFMIF